MQRECETRHSEFFTSIPTTFFLIIIFGILVEDKVLRSSHNFNSFFEKNEELLEFWMDVDFD